MGGGYNHNITKTSWVVYNHNITKTSWVVYNHNITETSAPNKASLSVGSLAGKTFKNFLKQVKTMFSLKTIVKLAKSTIKFAVLA